MRAGTERSSYADLLTRGVAVRDAFVGEARLRELFECAQVRRHRGEFLGARIGADQRLQRHETIRGDRTCWLDEPLFSPERALLDDLERMRVNLNREGFLGLFDLEAHYAWYPPGTAYARHVDQLMGREQRQISLVLYLNPAWNRDDGGQLRLFDADGSHVDVEPRAGRLACFLTAGREHEVLTTRADRWSISAWFRRRDGDYRVG